MITVAILTVSDSAYSGAKADISGPEIRKRCEELGWSIATCKVLPDESDAIAQTLKQWADSATASLILTTGGTGLAQARRLPSWQRPWINGSKRWTY